MRSIDNVYQCMHVSACTQHNLSMKKCLAYTKVLICVSPNTVSVYAY